MQMNLVFNAAPLRGPPGVNFVENSQVVINYIYSENIYYKIYIALEGRRYLDLLLTNGGWAHLTLHRHNCLPLWQTSHSAIQSALAQVANSLQVFHLGKTR